jgi:uncharacterized protein HemY
MQVSYAEATSSVGWVLFFSVLAFIALVLLLNGVMRAAKKWDAWRDGRRRNRPYRPRKFADP